MIETLKKIGRRIKEDWEKTNRLQPPPTTKPPAKPTPQPPPVRKHIIYTIHSNKGCGECGFYE